MEETNKKTLAIPCSEPELRQAILGGRLKTAILELLPIERDVLRLRMGLDDGRVRSFQEISELFGMSVEETQHHCMRASRKLRNPKYYR